MALRLVFVKKHETYAGETWPGFVFSRRCSTFSAKLLLPHAIPAFLFLHHRCREFWRLYFSKVYCTLLSSLPAQEYIQTLSFCSTSLLLSLLAIAHSLWSHLYPCTYSHFTNNYTAGKRNQPFFVTFILEKGHDLVSSLIYHPRKICSDKLGCWILLEFLSNPSYSLAWLHLFLP